jgi:PTH1 family peptidyl-tRNA hydrolase
MNILNFIRTFFKTKPKEDYMKKYLIVGLGNVGEKYKNTRHNIGFKVLDFLANKKDISFEAHKLGDLAKFRFKGRTFILLKPNTYMNLSGKAVKYWMTKEKIVLENILVICDDLNITYETIRLKPKGSAGGHNGLKDINNVLNSQNYARLRFGVGNTFSKGKQVDYVLGKWSDNELITMETNLEKLSEMVLSYGTSGIANTMNQFNKKV